MTIVKLASVASTNRYCEVLDLCEVEDFTCFWALEQTAGIGQRGNHWDAAPGKNLTFSLVLHPTFLPADRQFRLTQAFSLAICDFLSTFHFPLSTLIKWPNDIYVNGKKICGTLVSTHLSTCTSHLSPFTSHLSSAVCGIGLNVNQTEFPAWVPHPTSLALLTRWEYELEPLLEQLLHSIASRYEALRSGSDMQDEYLSRLMNFGVAAKYVYQGEEIEATITDIDSYGHLLLRTADGRQLCCGMKEIAFCLD